MAVLITNMKFPKRCLDCQLMGREKMYCQLHPRKDLNVIRVVSEKPKRCPLKEVSDSSVLEDIKNILYTEMNSLEALQEIQKIVESEDNNAEGSYSNN